VQQIFSIILFRGGDGVKFSVSSVQVFWCGRCWIMCGFTWCLVITYNKKICPSHPACLKGARHATMGRDAGDGGAAAGDERAGAHGGAMRHDESGHGCGGVFGAV
jgi:hypothetical protein